MNLPRVTLRELFLLVVIAAMGCGWWVERGHLLNVAEAESEKSQLMLAGIREENGKLKLLIADLYKQVAKPRGLHSGKHP